MKLDRLLSKFCLMNMKIDTDIEICHKTSHVESAAPWLAVLGSFHTIKGIYGELVVSYCLKGLPLLSVYFLSSMSKIFSQGTHLKADSSMSILQTVRQIIRLLD